MKTNRHYIGLSDAQVAESRQKYGANVLTPPEKDSLWKLYFEKFSDTLIQILMVIGVFAIGVSCYEYWGLHEGREGVYYSQSAKRSGNRNSREKRQCGGNPEMRCGGW